MHKLAILINELEDKIREQELINQAVSKVSVGWHIEHALLVINGVVGNLQKSGPENYRWKFNFMRTLIYTTNKIPRGKAQSPKSVVPKIDFNPETLKTHANITKEKIKILESLHRNNYFEHPFFGKLNLKPTIKFLEIHTKHHLLIIDDILKGK